MTLHFEGVGFGSGTGAGGKIGTVALVAMGSQPSTPYTVGSKWFYNGKIYTATTTSAHDSGVVPSYDTAYLFNGTYYYWDGSTLQGADESNLVHISGTETITGNKTFSGSVALGDNASAQTKPTSDTSDAPATTKFVKDFAEDGEWQKPADWIDIRSLAKDNSVYMLVAHSKPVESGGVYSIANYAYFSFKLGVSDANNTCDVYIDGIKVGTAVHNTQYEIDWAALYNNNTLKGGFDIMNPSELTSHIIRVTPTVNTDTITLFQITKSASIASNVFHYTGLLWIHFQIDNEINIRYGFGSDVNNSYRCDQMQAVTAKKDILKISSTYYAFYHSEALVKVPTFDMSVLATNPTFAGFVSQTKKLKYVKIKNWVRNNVSLRNFCAGSNSIEKIVFEDCKIGATNMAGVFSGNTNLKELPYNLDFTNVESMNDFLTNAPNLPPISLDFSDSNSMTVFTFRGFSSIQVNLVNLVVSPNAPFDYATAPQINIRYTNMSREALVRLFNSMPTVSDSQEIDVTGAIGAGDLTAEDLAIATGKGWTVTR